MVATPRSTPKTTIARPAPVSVSTPSPRTAKPKENVAIKRSPRSTTVTPKSSGTKDTLSALKSPRQPSAPPGTPVGANPLELRGLPQHVKASRTTSMSPGRVKTPTKVRSTRDGATSVSPLKSRMNEDARTLAAENEKLKAEVAMANEYFDREVASRLRDESERTLEKVEELWRVSQENEKLKEELAAAKAALEQESIQVKELKEALAAAEAAAEGASIAGDAELEKARHEAETARAQAASLTDVLAKFNRHTIGVGGSQGLCKACGNVYPQASKKLETAAYRSKSDRFGNGLDHARCGAKQNTNPALAASKPSLPGPGSHHTPRDNKGSFSTLGAAAAAEPYAVSSPQASVAWPEVAKDQEVTRI